MIPPREVARRARTLGVQRSAVEKDYVLSHVLSAVAVTLPELIFRGGTALSRAYWADFRLSEDLDFIHPGVPVRLEARLGAGMELASTTSGLPLVLRYARPREGWSRSRVTWDAAAFVEGELIVDINIEERTYTPVGERNLHMPYSDLRGVRARIQVVSLAEILANKWYMLDDRKEPRDLFDLWWAVAHEQVPFGIIAAAHRLKYGSMPAPQAARTAAHLRATWDVRLGHQLADLPSFDDAYSHVKEAFEIWQKQRTEHRPRAPQSI